MPRAKTDTSHLRELLGSVNSSSTTAVYRQIENTVRCAIASGPLKGGDRLPTKRELCEWLEVDPSTVARAYHNLEVMGLIYWRRGMGYYVQKGIHAKCREKVRAEIAARVFGVVCEAKAAGITTAEIKAVTKACYKAAGAPYGEVPKEVMGLAKRRK